MEGVTTKASSFKSDLEHTPFGKIPALVLEHYPSNSDEEAAEQGDARSRYELGAEYAIGFDRLLGYGLKYPTTFKDTHIGRL